MRFRNTRDPSQVVSFEEAVLLGWADGGGMFLPETIPQAPNGYFEKWKGQTYADLCVEILSMFVTEAEIDRKSLSDIVKQSFVKFGVQNAVNITKLSSTQVYCKKHQHHNHTKKNSRFC
jgi:threonine synthase